MAYVRTVKTASRATAVQIVWSSRRGSRTIEHVGSAHDEQELAALKAAAAERLAAGQAELDLGVSVVGSGPLPIVSSRMSYLWDGLCATYEVLGFNSATQGDGGEGAKFCLAVLQMLLRYSARTRASVVFTGQVREIAEVLGRPSVHGVPGTPQRRSLRNASRRRITQPPKQISGTQAQRCGALLLVPLSHDHSNTGRSASPAASIRDELHRRRRRRFALGRLSRFGFRPRLFAGRR